MWLEFLDNLQVLQHSLLSQQSSHCLHEISSVCLLASVTAEPVTLTCRSSNPSQNVYTILPSFPKTLESLEVGGCTD